MKELYKMALWCHARSVINHPSIKYIQIILNNVEYHHFALRFNVPYKRHHDYKEYHQHSIQYGVVHNMIRKNYYNDFKNVLKCYEDYYINYYQVNRLFQYVCDNYIDKYKIIIHLLKMSNDIHLNPFVIQCKSIHTFYKVLKYIQTSPVYTRQLIVSHLISRIFDFACQCDDLDTRATRVSHKLIKLIITLQNLYSHLIAMNLNGTFIF